MFTVLFSSLPGLKDRAGWKGALFIIYEYCFSLCQLTASVLIHKAETHCTIAESFRGRHNDTKLTCSSYREHQTSVGRLDWHITWNEFHCIIICPVEKKNYYINFTFCNALTEQKLYWSILCSIMISVVSCSQGEEWTKLLMSLKEVEYAKWI